MSTPLMAQAPGKAAYLPELDCTKGPFRFALPRTVAELRKIGPLKDEKLLDTLTWGDNTKSQIRELQFDGLVVAILADEKGKHYSLSSITIRDARSLSSSTNTDTIYSMASVDDIVKLMRQNPKGISFNDLCKVCDKYFGKPRQSGTSHRIYKTPWQGDPRVNIQNDRAKAKPYQVRQVLLAINRMERNDE